MVASVKRVLIAALLLGAAPAAFPDPLQDDLKWIETMAFAAHQLDYSGTFVFQFGSHVETSRITHVTDANGEYGRLESLDGTRREIVRHNGVVWCYLGENKVKMEGQGAEREFPALLPDRLSLSNINKNYVVSQAGEARVAGFHAHVILFQPKDNLRYGRRLWAESDSGLLLKTEVIDDHGAIVEQYAFTQLTLGGNIDRTWITPDKMTPANSGTGGKQGAGSVARKQRDAERKAAVTTAASGWLVDAVPEGFEKIAELKRPIHNHMGTAIQMVYSDGLASFSVFIEQNDSDEDDHPGLTSQGAVQVYSKLFDGHLVTVVGEVPPQTVIQVGDSVRFAGE
jgi:sigma-E factor negative regulatory protein RseB